MWKKCPVKQQPEYKCSAKLLSSEYLTKLKPVVSPVDIQRLKKQLSLVSDRKAFFFIGGDCAETFEDSNNLQLLQSKIDLIAKIERRICQKTKMGCVAAGRMAGQFFKPRSSAFEPIQVKTVGKDVQNSPATENVLTYRGDGINSFDSDDRQPNPRRLLMANALSIKIASFVKKRFLNGQNYSKNDDNLNILCEKTTIEILPSHKNVFVAHELLHLEYEDALTRELSSELLTNTRYKFNLSTHFGWIGNRTRDLNGAHIEFISSIDNPVGIKIGPKFDIDEIVKICKKVNPKNENSRLVLITRFGYENVEKLLPKLINEILKNKLNVIWQCDPMHGNTILLKGIKTRRFDSICSEIIKTARVHFENNSFLGGLHLEMTSEFVTECVGGINGKVEENDLNSVYRTKCDPRLNYRQALDVVDVFCSAVVLKN